MNAKQWYQRRVAITAGGSYSLNLFYVPGTLFNQCMIKYNIKILDSFCKMKISILLFVLISVFQLRQLEATANLEITLISFTNPGGKDFNGKNCDLFGSCDHRFYFGLDNKNGNQHEVKLSSIMIKETGEFPEENSNSFPSNERVKGVDNPIVQTFSSWPGEVLFKVYIEDVDPSFNGPDSVDKIAYLMNLTPSKSKDTANSSFLKLRGMRTSAEKASLAVSVRLYCNQNYFGADCSRLCEPKNNNDGHYTCQPDTGAVVCRPGWEDVSTQCTILSDDCVESRCQNGAICIDGLRNYTCSCLSGYSGRFCEVNIDECLPAPCANGGVCTDLVGDFSCKCSSNFVGKTCNSTACKTNNPCLNGGTCYGDLMCFCPRGFTDPICSTPVCNIISCKNNGVCLPDGVCDCPAGTLGDQCEILRCDIIAPYCKNGASCLKGKCVCPFGFEGELCEINTVCKTVVCQHSGTCVPEVSAKGWVPICQCTSTYGGERCEFSMPNESAQKYSTLPPERDTFGFLAFTEGKLMLAFMILSFILFVVIIILSICLCFKRKRSSTETTRLESREYSVVSSASPPPTFSSLPPKFPDSPSPDRSPPPKYMDNMGSTSYANPYVVDDSPYATLDEGQGHSKAKTENKLNAIAEGDA